MCLDFRDNGRCEEIVIDTEDTEPTGSPQFQVTTASGGYAVVLHQREKAFYEEARDKYLSDFTFTAASDFRTVDRLLLLEVQMFRTQDFLTRGSDYQHTDFEDSEIAALQRSQKVLGDQISSLQSELGLTKAQRDKAREDSVGAYIANLQVRAKQQGVKREKELGRALELTHELFATVDAWQRSNAAEREKLELPKAEDVLKWITDYIEVEFKAVDDYYRQHEQRFFIRDM
jgi:hypothetical protein